MVDLIHIVWTAYINALTNYLLISLGHANKTRSRLSPTVFIELSRVGRCDRDYIARRHCELEFFSSVLALIKKLCYSSGSATVTG